MALFRSERGIGRGEVAESRLEGPIFAAVMLVCAVALFAQHAYWGSQEVTIAMAVSLLVFGITVVRVDFGVYILVIAMMLSPEIEAGNRYSGERMLSFRYDDILILVIFMGVMVKLTIEGRLKLWQPSPINSGITFYYAVCLFSTLLALQRNLGAWDPRSAFFVMLKMLEFYLVFFLVAHAIHSNKEVRNQMVLFFMVVLVVGVYSASFIGATDRVSAPFEKGGTEPNTLGGYLVIGMCLAMALFTQAPFLRQKAMFLCISGCCFLPFLHTLSRASYLALLVGLSAVSIISRKYAIIGVLAVVLLFSTVIMPDKVIERVAYTFQAESGQEITVGGKSTGIKVDKSTHERFQVWKKVGFLLQRGWIIPLFGGGVSWETVLDSQYARVILETGLVGLAAFIFMQWRILRTTRQAYLWTEDWITRGIAMGVFATTLALIVHSFGTISFLIVRIMEPYWFLVALCVTIRNQALLSHRTRALEQSRAAEAARAGEGDMAGAPANAAAAGTVS